MHVILVAHGSRATEANDAHRQMCSRVAGRTGATVWPAFLELADPGIGDAVDAAVASGARELVVLPYFLLPGNHTRRDIPEQIDGARARHPGILMSLAPHIGDGDALMGLVADRIADLSAPAS